MTYNIEEIESTCFKIGLSKSIISDLTNGLPHKRSVQQNKALHVLFQNIAYELTRMGRMFVFKGVKGIDIEIPYTMNLVKETLWKPLQDALLDKESTTQLTNKDIEIIFELLAKFFAENDIQIQFPSIESLQLKNK